MRYRKATGSSASCKVAATTYRAFDELRQDPARNCDKAPHDRRTKPLASLLRAAKKKPGPFGSGLSSCVGAALLRAYLSWMFVEL
jgi:hypothetical protein